MKPAELRQILRATDPAAILVSSQVINRVIQQEYKLPSWLWKVPHRKCFVINRHLLFQYVEQDDLDLESNRLLPSRVILLARPDSENLANEDRETVLLKYWRRLFHANLHLNLERLIQEGSLSPEDIRDRIEQIGQAEFEEIHLVLDQDHYLFPHADEQAVYIEFAAVFLEMHYFEANLLPVYFPGILDFERIYHLVAQDLDAEALFNQTRLSGAPTPANRPDNSLDESNDYYWRLVRSSERAIRQGNTIRAAITRMRAARVAPASLTQSTRGKAMADLERLTMRLQAALHLSDEEAHEWLKDLPALLEKADQGSRPVEASLLYDLQKVCLDHERDIYTLDLVEWLLSAGKRPIKRPLPSQRLVRITKHLRSAAQRLAMARLSDTDRQHLADLLQTALHRSEDRLRARFRPLLLDALQDAGLQPSTPPERTAFHKIIEEMLDRIVEYGFLTFSDLRDILSRNQLKLPDLGDPQEFARGDQLLRLDRRLSTMLDGVYRPGEIYLRWLERFTALNFGTRIGRTITRYVTIPFGGAFLLTTGLELVMDEFHGPKIPPLTKWTLFAALSLFLFAFVNQGSFRQRIAHGLRLTGRTIRTLFIEVPNRLLHISALQRFLHSWAFQLFSWYLLKPLIVWALLYWWRPDFFRPWLQGLGIFVGLSVVLNTRLGKAALDTLTQGVVNLWDLLRAGLIPGLFRLLVGLFKHIIHLVEYVLFTVDEWLRFRSGDSMLSMVLRTVLGVLWFPVSWVARFYMVVLIEPGINPIKFPVSSLAAKIIYPFGVVLTTFMIQLLRPVMGGFLASVFSVTTVWLLPDAFGFLFWEMKENWTLYRANRRATLQPVLVGPHGETLRRLIYPGFHSGTVPKLYARLRQAEREAGNTGSWRAARLCRNSLEQVERSVRRFVGRELITLLKQSSSWQRQRVKVGQVSLATNRIRVELVHEAYPANSAWLEFEEDAGWLVAGIRQPGWLDQLTPGQQHAVITGLAGLYKLAGVQLVREQIQANLPPKVCCYDITARGLTVWLDHRQGQAIFYNLNGPDGELKPRTREGAPTTAGPVLEASRLIFERVPLSWQRWVENWQQEQEGHTALELFTPEVKLLPAAQPV